MLEAALQFIRDYGLVGFLFIALLLIIQDPDRAVKLKALFIKPFFNAFKWGSKQYIASEVGYTATNYLKNHVAKLVPSIPSPNVKIQWVRSPSDPVFQNDGTLIIRLQETDDQTRNILAATRIALPQIVCSSARTNLHQYATSAIDLTILKNLSDRLGKHAHPVFQKYFLSPEIAEDKRAAELFAQLIQLDETGIFVSIFLEELNLFGEYLFSNGDTSDRTDEAIAFIQYLLRIASRGIGEHIELDYISPFFKVGIVLLAISAKAETEGLPPYIRRIDKNIKLGCDSIYIASYSPAHTFLRRLTNALGSDSRINRVKWNSIATPGLRLFTHRGMTEIVLYRRNAVFSDSSFSDTIDLLKLKEGSLVEGTVFDVSQSSAMVDIGGLYGVVSVKECSWYSQIHCRDVLQEGAKYSFLVKAIDNTRDTVYLTRRLPGEDPSLKLRVPNVSEIVEAEIRFLRGSTYICRTSDGLEIWLPDQELYWGVRPEPAGGIIGSKVKLIITDIDQEKRTVRASLRRLDPDPWPKINTELPRGQKIRAKVLTVSTESIAVELPNGLPGYVPRQYVEDAGHSYQKFCDSLSPGRTIDVIVSNVFVKKRKIRLGLE